VDHAGKMACPPHKLEHRGDHFASRAVLHYCSQTPFQLLLVRSENSFVYKFSQLTSQIYFLFSAPNQMTNLHKAYWVVHNISNDLSPAVTALYWSAVYNSKFKSEIYNITQQVYTYIEPLMTVPRTSNLQMTKIIYSTYHFLVSNKMILLSKKEIPYCSK